MSTSSALEARQAVGRKLRDIRKRAGLTVTELGLRCAWHHSKTSRIENARTAPSVTDIRLWCQACDAEDEVEALLSKVLAAEEMYTEWRHQVRSGMKHLQGSSASLFGRTRLFRVYSSTLVPGLLQTEGYASALLTTIATFREVPVADGPAAAAARVERSQIIHEAGRRVVLLVEESALRHQIGDAEAMAAQLGYLLAAGALPAVSLGIIPHSTPERRHWPVETFHMYDDRLVSIELLSARVRITQPAEVSVYLNAFERLRSMAVYGAEARALIVRAIGALR
ncbi:helix-turn-helix transcriptional regulator [Streptomyces buecherae]|uniref:helix-turn-helix domain-containing protein n=1 Tax=Streptomyces buecherae TaxID=2763006 RepID=UPI0033D9527F